MKQQFGQYATDSPAKIIFTDRKKTNKKEAPTRYRRLSYKPWNRVAAQELDTTEWQRGSSYWQLASRISELIQSQLRVRPMKIITTIFGEKHERTNLYTAFAGHQQIRHLEIAVNDKLWMKILKPLQHLNDDAFHLRLGERTLHVVEKGCDLLFSVFHHEENATKKISYLSTYLPINLGRYLPT